MIGSWLGWARLAGLEAGCPGHSGVIGRAAGRAASFPFRPLRAVVGTAGLSCSKGGGSGRPWEAFSGNFLYS